jgi:hypothetical protein
VKRHASDLSARELSQLAEQAAEEAVRATRAAGLPTVGIKGEYIVKRWPDGRTQQIAKVGEPVDAERSEDAGMPFRVA